MMNSRFEAVNKAFEQTPVYGVPPSDKTSDYYGCHVFNRAAMRRYLSKETRKMIYDSIDGGSLLDGSAAEYVAAGMKQWAMDLGATHYAHWFQPLTGGTAEKHDSFAEPYGNGGSLEQFSGRLLAQQEPDASSFPSGGLRNTFEARGYTAWDPSSPAFVIGDTMFIPTVFVSYTGESLDYKVPLLRSINALNKASASVLELLGEEFSRCITYLGWEQEYFLVDRELYAQRPDLLMTERTLMGHTSSKNQQLEDHYFGTIPMRVLAFMQDLEYEAYKLGIPVKTRHNEVAPNQFELAPVYEEMNLAVDHNLMVMALMKRIAKKHGFKVLFHEKPFKGVNGSGKHCNWSIGTDTGINMFSPGKNDRENLRFFAFVVSTLRAVYKHDGLLKASVMSASNAHRLGANEAPPAIISSFLGSQIGAALDEIESYKIAKMPSKRGRSVGIPQIPELMMDNTDRNRTSPFAFTGNRFEFRAAGSSANCALPMIVLNTAVAEQLTEFSDRAKALKDKGMDVQNAVLTVIKEFYTDCKCICFDGNGYSDEWKEEAAARGLNCETSVPLIFDQYLTDDTKRMFSSMGVMNPSELEARAEIHWESYCMKLDIEARTLADLAGNHILPVAMDYQSKLAGGVAMMKEVLPEEDLRKASVSQIEYIMELADHIARIRKESKDMIAACDSAADLPARERAIMFHDTVVPYLESIRESVDALELIVDDRVWPLPKYREMLFVR
ncbi:MAG: glutamine synthetase III [Candidatus Methanomethylophilaceae archaeon]